MIDPRKLEGIARQISESLPPGLRNFAQDVEAKSKQILMAQLSKLDLVTREEFEVQTQVLLRTREKLEALEQKLAELEARGGSSVVQQQ